MNELPGMGGVNDNTNFILNCEGWTKLYNSLPAHEQQKISLTEVKPSQIYCAPVTGSGQNIGFANESDFYLPYFSATQKAGCGICAGDGTPDEKLKFGIEAVRTLDTHAAFFIKPYPIEKMIERGKWTNKFAKIIGCDIDAYEIVTMRDLVHLEKPTVTSLSEFRKHFDVPLAIKGVFTDAAITLVKDIKPEIVYISNHGGRIETRTGSTAEFLASNAKELHGICKEIWVDGGIRTKRDVQTALYFGADKVALARPLIAALISEKKVATEGVLKMTECMRKFYNS